jgi:hypothetical protein
VWAGGGLLAVLGIWQHRGLLLSLRLGLVVQSEFEGRICAMLDLPVGGIAQKKRRVIDSRVSPPALFIIYMVFLQYLDVDISTVEIDVIAASFFFLSNEVALLMPALLFFCFGLKTLSMIT